MTVRGLVLCSTFIACTRVATESSAPGCPLGSRLLTQPSDSYCVRDNGVKEGPARAFFADGAAREAGAYHDNKRQGVWTFWDADGTLLQTAQYEAGRPVEITPNLAPCPSGARLNGQSPAKGGRAVWCQRQGADGAWRNHGSFMSWHDDGRPQARGIYDNGELDGTFTMYYPDGSLKVRGAYTRGKEQGLWLSWHDNGRLFIRAVFQDGKENGAWTSWWEEGSKCSEGEFAHGLEQGPWTFWHPNGQKSQQGAYKLGRKDGWWSSWDSEGHTLEMEEYREGAVVSLGSAPPLSQE